MNDTIVIIQVIPHDPILYAYRSEIEFIGKEKAYLLRLYVRQGAVFVSQLDVERTKIDTIDLNEKKCPFGYKVMFDSYSHSNLEIYHKTDTSEILIQKNGYFVGELIYFDFGKVPKGLYKAVFWSDYGTIIRWVKN